jgi:hypothetical protein
MVKTILIQGIISLFVVFGFVAEPVSLSLNMPESTKADGEFLVEVTIKKGDIEGFARFQQELPVGFTAVGRQTANGEFRFEDQKVKIQWMRVPPDREIVISYAVQVAPTISGSFNFEGKFSYIVDNAVQTVISENKTLNVTGDEIAAAAAENAQTTYTYQNVNLKNVDCIRQKPFLNDKNEIIVNLMINKGDLKEFGKVQEQVPIGYTAESIKSKNSIFTFKNHIIKFLWMNMPPEPQFTVTYKLIPEGEVPNQAFIITGNFSYAENERTKTININERNVDLTTFQEEQVVAQANTQSQTTPVDQTTQQVAQQTTQQVAQQATQETSQSNTSSASNLNKNDQYAQTDNQTTTTQSNSTSATTSSSAQATSNQTRTQPQSYQTTVVEDASGVPAPEEGVAYRVQIAAGHKLVGKNYFKKLNITDQVQVEIHDGWNKYTVGNFIQYQDARNYRVYIWNNTPIHDAFVAAYNDGLRITVQEALMIANQKWYK